MHKLLVIIMKKLLFIFSFLCLSAVEGYAQKTLTLKDCLEIGIENNLSLESKRKEMQKSKYGVSENRARLLPNLGIVSYRDGKSFVMADIPGIIEGASAGKGLGLRFLRHIERNSLLLFMIPADSDDIRKEYEILLNELRTFNPEMLDKQRVLAITKCDMLDQELMDEIEPTLPESIPHVFISAISGLGISTLKDMLWEELNKESNKIEGKIESIAYRAKDMSHLKEELKDEGEDEDLSYEYVDDEDIEDLEDFEYEEEDWEDDRK